MHLRGVVALLIPVVILVVHGAAGADPLPGAGGLALGGAAGSPGESHAWAVVPDSGTGRWLVLHLPPRGSPGGAGEGSVGVAARIDEAPAQVGAWDSTVYLVFGAEPARPGERLRRVLRVTTARRAVGGSWEYDADGRLHAEPSLPGSGRLLGFVGTARGPIAMLDNDGLSLLRLEGSSWRDLALPQGQGAPTPGVSPPPVLVSAREGPALLMRKREQPGLWLGAWAHAGRRSEAGGEPALAWSWVPIHFEEDGAASLSGPVFEIGGRLTIVDRDGPGSVGLWTVESGRAISLGRVAGLTGAFAAAPLDDCGRLAFVCPVRVDEPPGRGRVAAAPEAARYEYHMREVSAVTGRVLYSGAPSRTSPVTPGEFRLLVLLLLGVMVAILLFVLRPGASGGRPPLTLPEGTTLAEPGRRLAAAALDLAPALLLAGRFSGIPLLEAFSVESLAAGGGSLVLLLDALGLAFLHTTLCEWCFRRSLGKAITGCEVVHVVIGPFGRDGELVPRAQRPRLWRAALRNSVKWGLAPMALAGIAGLDRRHAGDRLSGTAVIVRVEGP